MLQAFLTTHKSAVAGALLTLGTILYLRVTPNPDLLIAGMGGLVAEYLNGHLSLPTKRPGLFVTVFVLTSFFLRVTMVLVFAAAAYKLLS